MKTLVHNIGELSQRVGRDVKLMEVCGTHTMMAFRTGLRQLLPDSVRLTSGPGCPVCVTDASYIDAAIELSQHPNITLTTFGDLMRVPGSDSSLERERAGGARVRVVYSPGDALLMAKESSSQHVIFLGVGFETTAPAVAWSIWRAARDQVKNFSVLCAHKTMPGVMDAILRGHEINIDGFICPGHVSVITGASIYRFICDRYHIPCVVSGFEAWDMMKSIAMLLTQLSEGRADVEIEYSRSVTHRGNTTAQRLVADVFEPADTTWRGIGMIPNSGLAIRASYEQFDAAKIFGVKFQIRPRSFWLPPE